MPKHVYARGKRLWIRLKDESGEWVSKRTTFVVGQETAAGRYVRRRQDNIDAKREAGGTSGAMTVAKYAQTWTDEREARGVTTAKEILARLKKYALPAIGSKRLDEVKPRDIRDIVRALRTEVEPLAPRTIIDIVNSLHAMFESAEVDELVEKNPVKLKPGELPKKRDKDPTWRSEATYTVAEVERLISDPMIPTERRVLYALKAIAGLRHGEAAGMKWRRIEDAEPLARMHVVESWCSKSRRMKSTKTGDLRAVPLHPTLQKILDAWRETHWERIYGREPTDDDFVVPARTGNPVDSKDAGDAMKRDFALLEIRAKAGRLRDRGGHDLRGWYKTRCIEDGGDSLLISRTTHAPPKDVEGGYQRFTWAAICGAVAKLQVRILDGEALRLATGLLQVETKSRNRWRKKVTPSGLERVNGLDKQVSEIPDEAPENHDSPSRIPAKR